MVHLREALFGGASVVLFGPTPIKFYGYDNKTFMEFLEKAGCPLKVERGDRVFPVSDHSSDIIATLTRELKKRNVEILLNSQVKELLKMKHPISACYDEWQKSDVTYMDRIQETIDKFSKKEAEKEKENLKLKKKHEPER